MRRIRNLVVHVVTIMGVDVEPVSVSQASSANAEAACSDWKAL